MLTGCVCSLLPGLNCTLLLESECSSLLQAPTDESSRLCCAVVCFIDCVCGGFHLADMDIHCVLSDSSHYLLTTMLTERTVKFLKNTFGIPEVDRAAAKSRAAEVNGF